MISQIWTGRARGTGILETDVPSSAEGFSGQFPFALQTTLFPFLLLPPKKILCFFPNVLTLLRFVGAGIQDLLS